MKHSEAFERLVAEAKKKILEISVEELNGKKNTNQPFNLIDVREDHEWFDGYIDGAIHMGRGIIERDIEKQFPDSNTYLILYCGGGYRSALAAENLQKMGYTNVHSLAGGFRAWREKDLPIRT